MSKVGRRPKLATPSMTFAADADPHRIDAVLQSAGRIEPQIGGREAEIAAALLAVDHLAGRKPRIAEQLGGLDHAAGCQRRADGAGRDRAALVLQRRRDIDRKAVAGAFALAEKRGEPPRPCPKWKSKPMATPLTDKPLDQDAARRNPPRSWPASAALKVSTTAPSRPVAASRRSFWRSSVSRNSCSSAGNKRADAARASARQRARPVPRARFSASVDHRAMAAMHAVEIADRDHGLASAPALTSFVAQDGERLGCAGLQTSGVWARCGAAPCRPPPPPSQASGNSSVSRLWDGRGTETTASPSSTSVIVHQRLAMQAHLAAFRRPVRSPRQ